MQQCIDRIQQGELEPLLRIDQLREVYREAGHPYVGWHDALADLPVPFAPTYKYIPKQSQYDSAEGGKQRTPAWCDRVLWWSRLPGPGAPEPLPHSLFGSSEPPAPAPALPAGSVRLIDFRREDRGEGMLMSDHRAVTSLFCVWVRPPPRRQQVGLSLGGASVMLAATYREEKEVEEDSFCGDVSVHHEQAEPESPLAREGASPAPHDSSDEDAFSPRHGTSPRPRLLPDNPPADPTDDHHDDDDGGNAASAAGPAAYDLDADTASTAAVSVPAAPPTGTTTETAEPAGPAAGTPESEPTQLMECNRPRGSAVFSRMDTLERARLAAALDQPPNAPPTADVAPQAEGAATAGRVPSSQPADRVPSTGGPGGRLRSAGGDSLGLAAAPVIADTAKSITRAGPGESQCADVGAGVAGRRNEGGVSSAGAGVVGDGMPPRRAAAARSHHGVDDGRPAPLPRSPRAASDAPSGAGSAAPSSQTLSLPASAPLSPRHPPTWRHRGRPSCLPRLPPAHLAPSWGRHRRRRRQRSLLMLLPAAARRDRRRPRHTVARSPLFPPLPHLCALPTTPLRTHRPPGRVHCSLVRVARHPVRPLHGAAYLACGRPPSLLRW